MKKINLLYSIVSLLLLLIVVPSFNQVDGQGMEIKLDSVQKSRLLFEENAKLFIPAHLLKGQNNIFRVKGEPGHNVALAMSESGTGLTDYYGLTLRLGQKIKDYTGIIPANGVLEFNIFIENEPNLLGTFKYFEAVLWTKEDYSDIKVANIMNHTGRKSSINYLKIVDPPKSDAGFSFMPSMPGVNEFVEAGKAIQEMNGEQNNPHAIENDLRPTYYDSDLLEKNALIKNLNDMKKEHQE